MFSGKRFFINFSNCSSDILCSRRATEGTPPKIVTLPRKAFFTSLIFVLNPGVMLVSRGGFGDTNPLNLMLSLLFVFFFLNAIELKNRKSAMKLDLVIRGGSW
jgi:hypothetical protein